MSETLRAQSLHKDKGRGNFQGFGRTTWGRLRFYTRFAWRFVVLRQPEPLIYGIAITYRCNLTCRGCQVFNTGCPDMTWDQLVTAMQDAWSRGFRELYFSGGEHKLWRASRVLGLLAWLNGLFGYRTNRELLADRKEAAEGFYAGGRSFIYHRLVARG